MTEDEFQTQATKRGYGEVTSKVHQPDVVNDFHTHPFSAMLLVTDGHFTVTLEESSRVFGPGEWCEVPAGTKHFEKTDNDGATVLFATKAA